MLTREMKQRLHQVGVTLRSSEDVKHAIQTLLERAPKTKQIRLRRRDERIAWFRALNPQEQQSQIEQNVEYTRLEKAIRRDNHLRMQQSLRNEIQYTLYDLRKRQSLRPMFFHYHEEQEVYDKRTGVYRGEMPVLRATTCLLIDEETQFVIAKGLALVSYLDVPSRLSGRYTALNRAVYALETQSTQEPVTRGEALYIVNALDEEAHYMSNWNSKVVFHPDDGQLTAVELDRLNQWRQTRQAEMMAG